MSGSTTHTTTDEFEVTTHPWGHVVLRDYRADVSCLLQGDDATQFMQSLEAIPPVAFGSMTESDRYETAVNWLVEQYRESMTSDAISMVGSGL